ncbi:MULTISPECIES: hypothetical protein [Micrococcaceae]|uniref:hypothetical protein n=1 Tax=Micrococcaceae TaxID=1268 RepID=UPI000BB7C178|nr:hypothetical protein [Glutamicibacter sp. BW78]PCC25182.1 hypothetical protein CIK75_09190 [Glutamicibacter sp. BW78]
MSPAAEQRIADLEARVSALEDRLHTLVLCVQYQDDEPFDAEVSRLMLHGRDRVVLNLVLGAILDRANGQLLLPRPDPNHLDHPALDAAFVPEQMSADEAVRIVSLVVGGEAAAKRIIQAHRDRGFGGAGYDQLGIAPT